MQLMALGQNGPLGWIHFAEAWSSRWLTPTPSSSTIVTLLWYLPPRPDTPSTIAPGHHRTLRNVEPLRLFLSVKTSDL